MDDSDISGFDVGSHDRLEGSQSSGGGLIIKKKTGNEGDKHVFRSPQVSKASTGVSELGLDKLAREKRRQKEQLQFEEKRAKMTPLRRDWNQDDDSDHVRFSRGDGDHHSHGRDRHYRPPRIETPSHTGGVSDQVHAERERRHQRDREGRKHGIYASTQHTSRSRRKDDDVEKHRYRHYQQERNSQRYSHDKWENDSHSTRRNPDWENTPRLKGNILTSSRSTIIPLNCHRL